MTYNELKEVCKTCDNRDKNDNLWYMAWWSFCQTKCAKLKRAKKDDGIKR